MTRYLAAALAGSLGVLAAPPALAAGRIAVEIVTQDIGIEADDVTVFLTPNATTAPEGGRRIGQLVANGCTACPLRLPVTSATRFHSRQGAIPANEEALARFRGQAAAFTYHPEDHQVVDVHWMKP